MGDFAADAVARDIDQLNYWPEEEDDEMEEAPFVYVNSRRIFHEGENCYNHGCSGHFVLRINKKTNQKFLGCSNFPKCKANANLTNRST